MEDQLCETSLTGHALQELLMNSKELQVNGQRLTSVHASLLGGNQGYTSKIMRVTLKWSDPRADLPKSVVVKVIGSEALRDVFTNISEKDMEKMRKQLRHAHNVECDIYDLDVRSVVAMPICFAAQRSKPDQIGIMVFEDMSTHGRALSLANWGVGFTPGQLDSVLQALANVHAWSVNHYGWRKSIPSLNEFNVMESYLDNLISTIPESLKSYPQVFKNADLDTLKRIINNEKLVEIFGCCPKARYDLPCVLVHGDIQFMNTLFDQIPEDDVGDKLVGLVDWQMAHEGCAMEDMSRIMVICVSTKTRRENEEQILRRYVELFNAKVDHRENRVTYENCKRALDEMFAFFGVMWSCGLPMTFSVIDGLNLEPEQKQMITDRVISFVTDIYDDAMKLVKW